MEKQTCLAFALFVAWNLAQPRSLIAVSLFTECKPSATQTPCKTAVCPANATCNLILCYKGKITLSCPSGYKLKMLDGHWGRKNMSTCPESLDKSAKLCYSRMDFQAKYLNRKCYNEPSCYLYADQSVFIDSCYSSWLTVDPDCNGKHSYLELKYTCIDIEPYVYYQDWSPWAYIKCENGTQIRSRSCQDPPNRFCSEASCKNKKFKDQKQSKNCTISSSLTSTYGTLQTSSSLSPTIEIVASSTTLMNTAVSRSVPGATSSPRLASLPLSTKMFVSRTSPSLLVVAATSSFTRQRSSPVPPFVTPKTRTFVRVTIYLKKTEFDRRKNDLMRMVCKLLANETRVKYSQEQCAFLASRSKEPLRAEVDFVVLQKDRSVDQEAVKLVVKFLNRLVKNERTGELGPAFNGKISHAVLVRGQIEKKEKIWPIWMIILLTFACVAVIAWVICCVCLYSVRKGHDCFRRQRCTKENEVKLSMIQGR